MAIEVSPDLLAFLQQEEARARNEDLLSKAEAALDSYNGAPYGDEEEGRSQVVTRDVAETVDPMTLAVLGTCVSGDRVAEFEATAAGEEQDADDATEWMHRQFHRKRYRFLHDWIKAGLLETVAFAKASVEIKKRRSEYIVPDLVIPENALEAEPTGEYDEDGNELWRVIILEDGEPTFRDDFVPLEQVRVSPDCPPDLQEAPYISHLVSKSISDLVEMGFAIEDVEDLQDDGHIEGLSAARSEHNGTIGWDADRTGVMRRVWLREEYVRFDANGDGIAELLCVHRVGTTVLSIEEADFIPFAYWCPYPMPGRLVGQSFADKSIDIQRVTTVLERLGLDGLYQNLAPGTFIDESAIGDSTIDDLLNVRPGRIVRYKGTPPIPEQKGDVSGIAFNAIEFKIKQREARTGVGRFNQGLDRDAINDTATAATLMDKAGDEIEEFIARNFVCGLADFMAIKLKLASRYGRPLQMQVEGEYRTVDPRKWNDGMEIIAKVGLGSGRKEQRIAYRQLLLQIIKELKELGSPLVDDDKIHKAVSGLIRDTGLGSATDYINDPNSAEFQQKLSEQGEQPDPETLKAQAELQMKQAEMEQNAQLKAMDIQGKQEEAALKLELMRAEAEERAQLERDKAEFEREQAIAQMQFEMQMAREKAAQDAAMARYKADNDHEMKKYREGGSLSK